jgi:hypothetical protein
MHAPDPHPSSERRTMATVTVRPQLPADWPSSGLGDPGVLGHDLPDPSTLPPSSWVAITPGEARSPSLWAQLRRRRPPTLHLAVRCTALLLRGYVNVYADAAGYAWGQVPARS